MEASFIPDVGLTKAERYEHFTREFALFIRDERREVSVLANAAAALHEAFRFFWTGFYLADSEEWLALGPFQGSPACWRIRRGKGVCGTAWAERCTQVVLDVDRFPGHIACSSLSRSEIVVPLIDRQGAFHGVLDIDSDRIAAFDETDRLWLERICRLISDEIYRDE